MQQALADQPVSLDVATNIAGATAMLDGNDYCGVVLDLGLEGGSGIEILRHMADREILIPTVLITRRLPESVRQLPIIDEIKLVFAKPIHPGLLASTILGLCGIDCRTHLRS